MLEHYEAESRYSPLPARKGPVGPVYTFYPAPATVRTLIA